MDTFQNRPTTLSGRSSNTKRKGDAAEDEALAFLQNQGLQLLQRNYRTPGRGGGEIDLIVRDPQGTVVFVEVRSRSNRQRIVFAARCFLSGWRQLPACRFDVVVVESGELQWLKSAFDA